MKTRLDIIAYCSTVTHTDWLHTFSNRYGNLQTCPWQAQPKSRFQFKEMTTHFRQHLLLPIRKT